MISFFIMKNMAFDNFTTERLYLREISLDDAEEIYQLRSSETVNEFVDRPRAKSIDDAKDFIQKILLLAENDKVVFWAITIKGDPKLIGTALYWNIAWDKDQAELGYELLPEYQGKGIMQEVLESVIAFGFNNLNFKIITANPKKGNQPSIKLLQKLGFVLTGEDKDGYLVYHILSA